MTWRTSCFKTRMKKAKVILLAPSHALKNKERSLHFIQMSKSWLSNWLLSNAALILSLNFLQITNGHSKLSKHRGFFSIQTRTLMKGFIKCIHCVIHQSSCKWMMKSTQSLKAVVVSTWSNSLQKLSDCCKYFLYDLLAAELNQSCNGIGLI